MRGRGSEVGNGDAASGINCKQRRHAVVDDEATPGGWSDGYVLSLDSGNAECLQDGESKYGVSNHEGVLFKQWGARRRSTGLRAALARDHEDQQHAEQRKPAW